MSPTRLVTSPSRSLRFRLSCLIALAFTAVGAHVSAAEEQPVNALIQQHCVQCHGSDDAEADLRLDSILLVPENETQQEQARETWHKAFRLIQAGQMPPEDESQLSDAERETILNWIEASYGKVEDPNSTDHWSFHAPVRPEVPDATWSGQSLVKRNPIDGFIAARLNEKGLAPSEPADRRTLLRRVTLDLTGLLPTPDETTAFVEDTDAFESAYHRVIDRLLDSPHYGERWAQHWLDVIRWAETVGFETNLERADAWHYRDWVIRSLNDDKPYDQFLAEQLIGDSIGQDAALGFLVAGPANLPGQIGRDEEAMRQARQDELDEVIRTVSQSLFGLTVGCARCHDHKFDPIRQQDYYSMQAIFAGLKYGHRRLRGPLNDQWTAKVPAAREQLANLRDELESIRNKFGLRRPVENVQSESFQPRLANSVRMEIAATANGTPSLYEFQIWAAASDESAGESAGESARENVALASAGAVPSASSFALANQTRHFENLVDGSVDRRQAFPWVAATGGPAWIQIDLPQAIEIDGVTWHNGSSTPADYEIRIRNPENGQWETVAQTRDRLPRTDDMRDPKHVHLDSMSAAEVEQLFQLIRSIRAQDRELQRLNAGPQTYAASFTDAPAETNLLRRGDPMQPTDKVIAAVPAFLDAASSAAQGPAAEPATELGRRKMLVEHLTGAQHPLTARVMVNRIWQHHFGVGLVETASDFGRMGAAPSHPKLLDWLAVEFIENDWSVKHLHRLIVTSQTYLQSSHPRREAIEIDANARLLWRYPPRRLEAEAIRDTVLMASGKLNREMHGRGFDFFNQRGGLSDYRAQETFDAKGWRRMIYAHKIRMQSVDVFGAFDCPDAGQMTPRRNHSITPVQSLGLLNSPFINRQAEFFAERLVEKTGGDLGKSITFAFEIALTRSPTPSEHAALVQLADDHGLAQVCRVMFNTSEFVFLR